MTEDFGKIPIVSACSCLMKRDLLVNHEIRFDPKLRYGEDYLFMAEVLIHVKSFYYLKGKNFYNYRQYNQSRSKKFQPQWWSNFLYLNKKLKYLLADSQEFDFGRQLKLQLIHSSLFFANAIFSNNRLRFAEKLNLLRELFKEPELKTAFYNLNFQNQKPGLKIVLYFVKYKLALGYIALRKLK